MVVRFIAFIYGKTGGKGATGHLSIHLEPLFSSLLLYFHKFLFENVSAVYYCVFEGLRILLDHDSVARDAHLHFHVLVLMVWKQ